MPDLADRAARLLREHGVLSDDDLCRALFSGTGAGWSRLLAQTLRDPRFRRDGQHWCLAEAPATRPATDERPDEASSSRVSTPTDAPRSSTGAPVAFVFEATGQDYTRHRIVQIAACRIVDGAPGPSWFSHVDPGRRLPRWLAARLGADETFGEDAPSFATAWRAFLDFVGDAPLVGLDVGWQIAMARWQLGLAGLPDLENPVEDLLGVAARVVPDGKPQLETLAARLGLPVGRRYREAAEARLLAAVAGRLLTGEAAAPVTPTMIDPLLEAIARAPDRPGVYQFLDSNGDALYVGKANRLRTRLQSYARRPPTHDRALTGLRALTRRVEWREAPDDLHASLEEARLLSALRPPFNTQRRTTPQPHFLRLDESEAFPRLRLTTIAATGAFGPFPSASAAAKLAQLAKDAVPIRTCARALGPRVTKRGATSKRAVKPPCGRLAAGTCVGPCAGTVSPSDYAPLVDATRALLSGDDQPALALLRERIAHAGNAADAERLRRVARRLVRAAERGLAPALGYDPANVIVLLPADRPRRLYAVVDGMLRLASDTATLGEPDLAAALHEPRTEDAERGGALVARWLATRHRTARVLPLGAWRDVIRELAESRATEG